MEHKWQYIVGKDLIKLNAKAIKEGRNRTLNTDKLDLETKYPIIKDMLVDDYTVRAQLVIDSKGNTVWFDFSVGEINKLPWHVEANF